MNDVADGIRQIETLKECTVTVNGFGYFTFRPYIGGSIYSGTCYQQSIRFWIMKKSNLNKYVKDLGGFYLARDTNNGMYGWEPVTKYTVTVPKEYGIPEEYTLCAGYISSISPENNNGNTRYSTFYLRYAYIEIKPGEDYSVSPSWSSKSTRSSGYNSGSGIQQFFT